MKLYLSCLFIFVSLCLSLSDANDQLMLCKPVSSVFQAQGNNSEIPASPAAACSSTSRPGKQGPPGIRGAHGPAGPPGVVDYERINSSLLMELQSIKRQLQCLDGVAVGNTCYKLIYRVGVSVDYEKARSLCAYHGGGLAEIPTEEAYNAVYTYVQRNWYITINEENSNVVRPWLGSSHDGAGNVILTSGRRGFERWHPTQPIFAAGRTRVGIHVSIRPEDRGSGMFIAAPTYSVASVPLCQFTIE